MGRPSHDAAALGLTRKHIAAIRSTFGAAAFSDYFGTMSAMDLRAILLGFDPQTLILADLGRLDLLQRLDWFATGPVVPPHWRAA